MFNNSFQYNFKIYLNRCELNRQHLKMNLHVVVNSSSLATDRNRFEEAGYELDCLLKDENLDGIPCLVFANKQDIPLIAASAAEIAKVLNLHAIKGRDWHIQACSAKTGQGLDEGVQWVLGKLDLVDSK